VLALEHIFELHEGVDPPFIELGDRLIDGEFDAKFAVILMDFDTTFGMKIAALQLVTFR
jgi:hypothetical protein